VEAIKAAQLAADCGEGLQQATSLDSSELEQRLAPARGRKAAKARARQAKKLPAVLDHARLFANVYAALAHGRLGSPEAAVRHWKAAAALAPQSAILRCHAGDRQAQTAARKRALGLTAELFGTLIDPPPCLCRQWHWLCRRMAAMRGRRARPCSRALG